MQQEISDRYFAAARQNIPRVFISGTFSDIAKWRQKARDILSSKEFLPVDLSTDQGRSLLTRDHINGKLDQADIYLGIFGHRYGTRVDDVPDNPSWTHYEFDRFFARFIERRGQRPALEMLLLQPALPSPAARDLIASAREVMRPLPAEIRRGDRKAQRAFLKSIRGGSANAVEVAHPDEARWIEVPASHASRMVKTFATEEQFNSEILAFLLALALDWYRQSGPALPVREQAPAEPQLPHIPAQLVGRLAPAPRPRGLCVVVPRMEGVPAIDLSRALCQVNPWDVEDIDWHLDAGAEGTKSIEDVLEDIANQYFAAEGDTIEERVASLAAEILDGGQPRMLCIDRLKPVPMRNFIQKVWIPLEKALQAGAAYGGDGALLLVLSMEAGFSNVKAELVQPAHGEQQPFEKPILISPASLGLDAGPQPPPASHRYPRHDHADI